MWAVPSSLLCSTYAHEKFLFEQHPTFWSQVPFSEFTFYSRAQKLDKITHGYFEGKNQDSERDGALFKPQLSLFYFIFFPFRASAEAPPGTLLRQGSGKTSAAAAQPLRAARWGSHCCVPTGPWCSTPSSQPHCVNATLASAHPEHPPRAQLLGLKLYGGGVSQCKLNFLCTLPYPLESWIIVSTQQIIKLSSTTEHSLIRLGVDCKREIAGCIDPLHFTLEINPHFWKKPLKGTTTNKSGSQTVAYTYRTYPKSFSVVCRDLTLPFPISVLRSTLWTSNFLHFFLLFFSGSSIIMA